MNPWLKSAAWVVGVTTAMWLAVAALDFSARAAPWLLGGASVVAIIAAVRYTAFEDE